MVEYKKRIYIFGCIMWDIIGKPFEAMSKGKDSTGSINERLGGVAFNIALGLSKILNEKSYELNLVAAIGKNEKTDIILTALKQNNINTKYLIIKGNRNDQYLSIETKTGEIFGSINSSNTFLTNQSEIENKLSHICTEHKKSNNNAIFIFDGNCSREFLSLVKKQACDDIFTKYFIPANYSKLTEFKDDASFFKGFNLLINLKEATMLVHTKNLKNSEEASKVIFEKIKTKKCLTIVTDGPNIAYGISNEEVAEVRPKIIKSKVSRLGAGDMFFAYFLSYKELNPSASLTESLNIANKKTHIYLNSNDQKIYK